MSGGFKIALAVIGASVVIAAVIPAMLPHRTRSSRLDVYLCDRCAMEREVVSRWRFGIRVRGSERIIDTSLSRQMASGEAAKCEHAWVMVYFDHHGTRVMGHRGVNSRAAIRLLTKDHTGAAGLVQYARETGRRPDVVWHTLFHHLAEFSRGKSADFETWLLEENAGNSEQIAAWLRANYGSIEIDRN